MSKVNQLKNKARREEQRENWSKAIELYTQALDASRKEGEAFADLSLYNRIGDIYLRIGQKNTAVRYYEQAIERYADQDLHTSAIALCNKVLRIHPERSTVFLQLGRLHLATNLIAEARSHFHRYAESMRERGTDVAAFEALEELIAETGDSATVHLWATWLVAHSDRDEALDRVEDVASSLVAHGIEPDRIREQVRTGEVSGIEVDSQVGAQPDPLAGAFLTAPDEHDASGDDDAAAEVETPRDEPADMDDEALLDASDETPEAPETYQEAVGAAGSLSEKGHGSGRGSKPIEADGEDLPAAAAASEHREDVGIEQEPALPEPEPLPLELGSVQWSEEAEEMLSELNRALESSWAANEPEGQESPRSAPDEDAAGETELEVDEHPSSSGDEPPEGEPLEATDPVASTDEAVAAEAEAPEPVAAPADPSAVARGYDAETREPDSDSRADAAVSERQAGEWESDESDSIAADAGSTIGRVSTEPSEIEIAADAAREPVGFGAEPPLVEDEVPEPAAEEPSELTVETAADTADGGWRDLEESAERGEVAVDAGFPPDTVVPSEDEAERQATAEDGWEDDARAAMEEVLAAPDPDLEDEDTLEPEPLVPLAAESPVEPVVEVAHEPDPEQADQTTITADVEGTPEAAVEQDDDLPVVQSPFAPRELPDAHVAEADIEALEAETIAVEGPLGADPEPVSEQAVEPEPEQVAAQSPAPASESEDPDDLSDMEAPLAEPRLTVEEDPEDAFRDWVQSASTGVLKRALPELENRKETEKALLVIRKLAQLEDHGVDFKTRLVAELERLGRNDRAAEAAVALGTALEILGRRREARAAYERALGLEPGIEDAARALELLGDVDEEEKTASREVDVRPTPYMPDHVNAGDTQAVFERPARPPTNGHGNGHGNGDGLRPYSGVAGGAEASADFEQLLSEFRAELTHKPSQGGSSSRTELGASLKEMGRLDDAIRELQAAVREPSPPPMAFELLGEAFLEKGQGRIAVRLLEKALGQLGNTDRELLGVLYQLGVAYESLTDVNKALLCYERIFSVDIDYKDIQERIMACSV
ncbi:MAG: tetratricopeptide repeat protein [Gemmatimonadota bacterium]|nr:tetratricopeptide repeat protein [Gemmatimonadota bacterium]